MTVRNTLVYSCRAIMLFSFDQTLTNVVMNSYIMLEHCVHTPSLFSVFKRGFVCRTGVLIGITILP